jgi:hypothetical protein
MSERAVLPCMHRPVELRSMMALGLVYRDSRKASRDLDVLPFNYAIELTLFV